MNFTRDPVLFYCDTIKLREVPKALNYQVRTDKVPDGQVNDLGYGKNVKRLCLKRYKWVICSQVLICIRVMPMQVDAVHRLNVGGH
jgi:hypothetical protein